MVNSISNAQIEQIVIKVIESRLQEAIEEYVEQNELRVKELSLIERTVRVEEELRSLREISEAKFEASEKRFDALQREMKTGFDAMDKRFESLQREMKAGFEASEKRFESLQREMNARFEASDKRFESLQREMDARFEAMDKRFSTIQWLIGILVGIPAIAITITQLIKVF